MRDKFLNKQKTVKLLTATDKYFQNNNCTTRSIKYNDHQIETSLQTIMVEQKGALHLKV